MSTDTATVERRSDQEIHDSAANFDVCCFMELVHAGDAGFYRRAAYWQEKLEGHGWDVRRARPDKRSRPLRDVATMSPEIADADSPFGGFLCLSNSCGRVFPGQADPKDAADAQDRLYAMGWDIRRNCRGPENNLIERGGGRGCRRS